MIKKVCKYYRNKNKMKTNRDFHDYYEYTH